MPTRHRLLRLLPIVALCGAATAFAYRCLVLIHSIGSETVATTPELGAAAVGFVASVLLAVLVEVVCIGRRFELPEERVRSALQRIRTGDIGFRVSLRRGDPLVGLARECNELLEWLNANPPIGVLVGGDVVQLPADDGESVQ